MRERCPPPISRYKPPLLLWRGWTLVLFVLCTELAVLGQGSGRICGVVRNASGAAVGGVSIVATNQVTSRAKRTQSRSEGTYSLKLPAGAYRITVEPGYVARFEKDKNYGDFAIPRGDTVENIIVTADQETKLDIGVEEKKEEALVSPASDAPTGHAGKESVASEPQREADRQAVRDRWRVGFPEYDRYGDRAARGRDIPFKRGRWWDPYNQSVLKGDYPIRGNKLFMILSTVSTTTIEQRRAPTPSGGSTDEPRSGEFFGQPEELSANETLQLSFELFHGDTVFRPRDLAIKITTTFSIPNYLNARENGVVNVDVRRGTNRTDTHISLEEAFAEVKLTDVNENYDFISVRAGIQP